jgi:hypothetical protein
MSSRQIRFTTPAGHPVSYFGVRHYVLIKDWPNHAVIVRRSDSAETLAGLRRRSGAVTGQTFYIGNCRTGGLALVHPSGRVESDPKPAEQIYHVLIFTEPGEHVTIWDEKAYSPMGAMIQISEQRAGPRADFDVDPETRQPVFGVPDPGCPTCYGSGTIWKQIVIRCPDCPGDPVPALAAAAAPAARPGWHLAADHPISDCRMDVCGWPGPGETARETVNRPLCWHRSAGGSDCLMDHGHYSWPHSLHSDTVLLWDDSGTLCNLNGQPIS